MINKKSILFTVLSILLISILFRFTTNVNIIKDISGSLQDEAYDIIYSTDNSTFNTLHISENKNNTDQVIYKDTHEYVADIVISKELLSKLCSYYSVNSHRELYQMLGQPVWASKHFIVFDSWPIGENIFSVFDLSSEKQIEINKTDKDEIILQTHEEDNSIQLYTNKLIYTIYDGDISVSEYKFNNYSMTGYDFTETDMSHYISNDKYLIYANYAYVFGDNDDFSYTSSFFNFYCYDSDSWQVEKLDNKTILDFYIENQSFFIICVENNSSSLNVLEYSCSKDNVWYLSNSYDIKLDVSVQHRQHNWITTTEDHIIYYPLSEDSNNIYLFLIDKNSYKVQFAGNMCKNDVLKIYQVSIQ